MHRVPATGGTLKPAIASITEFFVVIEFSNVCFWLTKWFSNVLVDYSIHILTYKNPTCCSHGCVSFFAECIYTRQKACHRHFKIQWKQLLVVSDLEILCSLILKPSNLNMVLEVFMMLSLSQFEWGVKVFLSGPCVCTFKNFGIRNNEQILFSL